MSKLATDIGSLEDIKELLTKLQSMVQAIHERVMDDAGDSEISTTTHPREEVVKALKEREVKPEDFNDPSVLPCHIDSQ